MAVGDTHVFFHTSTNTSFFPNYQLLFSHASEQVKGENTPARNYTSTGSETHNHQVMSPIRSPLSPPGEEIFGKNFQLKQKCW